MRLSTFFKLVVKHLSQTVGCGPDFLGTAVNPQNTDMMKNVFLAYRRQLNLLFIGHLFFQYFKIRSTTVGGEMHVLQILSIFSYFCHFSFTNLPWFLSAETANPAHWVYRGFLHSQEYTLCLSREQFHGLPCRCEWRPDKPSYPATATGKYFTRFKHKSSVRATFVSCTTEARKGRGFSFLFFFFNMIPYMTVLIFFLHGSYIINFLCYSFGRKLQLFCFIVYV